MRKKTVKRKKEINIPTKNILGIFIANIVGLFCTVTASLFASLIMQKAQSLTDNMIIYLLACIALGAFVNGFIAAKRCTVKGIVSGLISFAPFSLLLTFIMLFFTGGKLSVMTFSVYAAALFFSALGGILSANTKRRR